MTEHEERMIEERVRELGPWYQNLELAGVSTNAANPDYPASRWRTIEPFVPRDLSGKTVLDLGCNAGYFAQRFRERGAEVLGVDWSPEAIEQARFAADVAGLDIEFRVRNIYDFVLREEARFDLVVFLGVLYHTRYPLLILDRLAQITGERLYFQTIVRDTAPPAEVAVPEDLPSSDLETITHPGFPRLYFVEGSLDGAWNNWFLCNHQAVEALLRSSGFTGLEHAGGDCWIAAPPLPEGAELSAAHDLRALRGSF